jgi:hypothetical protein
METLSLEEILKDKSRDFVLDKVSEIVESKKTSVLNREQVILNWILNSIYKNVSKKNSLQKSSIPFLVDYRVWYIFGKILEKRRDFSIDMSLLKGIGIVCSATLPTSPLVSSTEIQVDMKRVSSKIQIIEQCSYIMDALFRFSNSYWPSVENYSALFVTLLPPIIDTLNANKLESEKDVLLVLDVIKFMNNCCILYVKLLATSRYEKRVNLHFL